MIYKRTEASHELSHLIKSFWMIDSEGDAQVYPQKIIPDGFPEMIFHYGDPYRINISGTWKTQGKELIAGQIKNHFFLENMGVSKMFAIKFQPWALTELFGLNMSELVNKVITIPKAIQEKLLDARTIAMSGVSFSEKVNQLEDWFKNNPKPSRHTKYQAIELIHQKKGAIQIDELSQLCNTSERTLERYFKSHVGLSPKFYSRIIRFSSIFRLIQEGTIDWQDIIYKTGYYDQSHFIKNFKEFTGEDPSKYGFSEENMANFFLKK